MADVFWRFDDFDDFEAAAAITDETALDLLAFDFDEVSFDEEPAGVGVMARGISASRP